MTFVLKTIIANLAIIMIFCGHISAQKLLISGKILTDSGKVLKDCYLKIAVKTNNRVLSYSSLGNENTFSVEVPFSNPDSFYISASHIGYRYITVVRYVNKAGSLSVKLIMPLAPDTLNNIALHAPPVWVNGDTTFFRANSFKTGDEHKLKDLVTKMPGFEIDKQGNLLYKKQVVDKVMIEGEQLFADKVKLMLDNFPVYVIKNVQVIKNQTDDPLLNGLVNDNKLFVNVSLTNKAKLKTAFGDGEAGIGTANKYFINPVLFSIYGKIKMAYIGNWNNIGNGIGWKQQDELKPAPVRTVEKWMMQSDQLHIVNDLENRRYILNGQSDNRFQINIPLAKKIKSTTEIDLIKDRQRQSTYSYSSLFNGKEFIKQADTNSIHNNPYSLLVRQNLSWNISSTKNLTGQLSLYHNGNNSTSHINYDQAGILSNAQNSISNNWDSYLISLSYTKRISMKKAVKWFADISEHNYPQNVRNISASWPSIFHLQDTGYNVMVQKLVNKTKMTTLGWTSIIKTKKSILETGILLNALSTSINTDLLLTNLKMFTPIYPEGFSNNGNYYTTSAIGYARKTLILLKLPFSVKGELGYGASGKSENTKTNFHHSLYSLDVTNQSKLGKDFLGKFDASYSKHQMEANKLDSILLPNAFNSFHNNLNVGLPLKTLTASYNLAFSWKPLITFGLNVIYTSNFSSFSSINHLNQFIQISSDSLTKRTLNNFILHFNTNIYSFKNNFHFSTDIQYDITPRLIKFQDRLLENNMNLFFIATTLSKNWDKIYFINMNADFTQVKFNLPGTLQKQVAQNVSDIKVTFSQRVALNKHSNIVLDTDYFDKNMFTSHHLSFVMMDAEYNFTIPKSPLSFTVRLQNITNQSSYTYVDNSPLAQNFYFVPLIKRNLFLSVRYEL